MANEPDIVQRLSVDFNVVNDLTVDFNSPTAPLTAQFGTVYIVGGDCRVLYATTETWNSQPQLVSEKGYIYIYCDYRKDDDNNNIASIKVGDGNAYLIDMPFTDELIYDHMADNIRHITQQERDFWNNKVRCYMSEVKDDVLIFTKE